ncbi:hypothetical protein BOTBODRAFT_180505 [Botryobasidium botryosum FD-172 SS1]|uniref:Zn(2)-C6 fungal-type domain-containing protein n=1 Tax=Botryobasidium botryosum (strain FD-172 SS1) TaxID=930990 RepID=A0A067LZ28_BOTB1|nr:hypothetical protein BOTBODRAFT_180505 [Botryobasidium botryosum FD-172 SS1]
MSTATSFPPSPPDLFSEWGKAIRYMQELLAREPDAKEDDSAIRANILSWCEQVGHAADTLTERTCALRDAKMPVTVESDMTQAIEHAILWGERLQREDAEVAPRSPAPVSEEASTALSILPASAKSNIQDALADPVTPAPALSIDTNQLTPRRSARQEEKSKIRASTVADGDSDESEKAAQTEDEQEDGSEGSKEGWLAYDIAGKHIGIVRCGLTRYLTRCSSCVTKGREECEGPAGVACLACKKSGSKCSYAFHGKKDLRPPKQAKLTLKRKAIAAPDARAEGGDADVAQRAPDGADAKRMRASHNQRLRTPASLPPLSLPPSPFAAKVSSVIPASPLAKISASRVAEDKIGVGGAGSNLRPSNSHSIPKSPGAQAATIPQSVPRAQVLGSNTVAAVIAELHEQKELVISLTANVCSLTAEVAQLKTSHDTECERISKQRKATTRLLASHAELTLEVESLRQGLKGTKH